MATEPTRRRFAAAAVLIITFVSGGVTGAGLISSCGHRGPRPGRHLPPPFEELGLSAEQRSAVEVVFEKYRPGFEAVFQESQPKVRALHASMDAELLPLLTQTQRERFTQLEAERERRGFRPPPPPP